MGGPLSVTFSNIFMIKMENYMVIPKKPIFDRRYVDDIFNRRKKNIEDSLRDKKERVSKKISILLKRFSLTSKKRSNLLGTNS